MRQFFNTIIFSFFLFNVSIFAQTSCGTIQSFTYTSTPVVGNPSQSTYVVTISFINSTGTNKGIEYYVFCGSNEMVGKTCFQTIGNGMVITQSHSFTCATNAVITVPWLGYTSSSGGCSGGTCGNIAEAVLPVKFKSISGSDHEKYNTIEWETASESNSYYFMVQKSIDGITWDDLEKIESKSYRQLKENTQYSAQDHDPFSTTFYRIAHFDLDGSFSVSDIIKVAKENTLYTFGISPSPAFDILNINVPVDLDNSELTIQIFNTSGKIVYEGKETSPYFGINIGNLLPDVYVAKVIIQNEVLVKQFIKI